jgi:hypothetical protein
MDDEQFLKDVIKDDKRPPSTLPSLYCPWYPTKDGDGITFVDNGRYNNHYGWLIWLMDNIFKDKYKLSGSVTISTDNRNIIIYFDNNGKLRSKFTSKNQLLLPQSSSAPKQKTDADIVNDLYEKTKNDKLKWYEDGKSINVDIKVSHNIWVVIYISYYSENNLHIYMKKGNLTKYYKTISSQKVQNLSNIVKLKLKNEKEII